MRIPLQHNTGCRKHEGLASRVCGGRRLITAEKERRGPQVSVLRGGEEGKDGQKCAWRGVTRLQPQSREGRAHTRSACARKPCRAGVRQKAERRGNNIITRVGIFPLSYEVPGASHCAEEGGGREAGVTPPPHQHPGFPILQVEQGFKGCSPGAWITTPLPDSTQEILQCTVQGTPRRSCAGRGSPPEGGGTGLSERVPPLH